MNACLIYRPDVVMVDPLVAINAVPRTNYNQLIRRVMTVLKIGLTQRFNCALVIAHHDLKAGGSNEDSDQTNARGAGDIVNAVRFEFAVKKMSVQQAGAMNVQETGAVYPPEAKSLAEATGLSGCAGVKLHRQEALCLECKGLGDEAGGAVCEGPLRGTG